MRAGRPAGDAAHARPLRRRLRWVGAARATRRPPADQAGGAARLEGERGEGK